MARRNKKIVIAKFEVSGFNVAIESPKNNK